jgi:hypothetical protein
MTNQRDPELETIHLQVPRSRGIPALVKMSKYLDRGLRGFSGFYLDHHLHVYDALTANHVMTLPNAPGSF